MDSYYDANGEAYHREPVVSPNRPPQFNESNCGYRCGWGCCEPRAGDDDGGDSESDAPTLVDAAEDDVRALSLPDADDDAQHGEMAVADETEGMARPIAYLENNLHHHQIVIVDPDPSVSSHQYLSPDEADSVENEASSGSHSVVTFDERRIDLTVSDVLIGIPDWIGGPLEYPEGDQAGRTPLSTLFRVPPLRLSAQYEHCRGNPYCHMVIRDDMVLPAVAYSNWSSQAFLFDRAFSHSDDVSSH